MSEPNEIRPPEETIEEAVPEKNPRHDPGRELFDWAESLVPALVFVVLLFVFAVRLIGVDGDSMLPTLQSRNYLIVSDLYYDPTPGDIVVMTKEGFLINQYGREDSFVKRIIAVEGQTVDIDYDAGIVYVDGEALDEPFTYSPTNRRGDMKFPQTVPEGCVFVLGDNRNGSTDSRYTYVGMVDERYIVGRVLLRILPIREFGVVS
ncbi:MAG: signal peptidase I [Clostridiaceae bacterium]|nr:signal peptidase I [Clostridiaceae bacterium]